MTDSLFYSSAFELSQWLSDKKISSVELTSAIIKRTKETEDKLNAFISFDEAYTLNFAKASDKRRAQGSALGPLDGILISNKDLICEKSRPLTCASRILENYVSPYDSTATDRLKKAGAVLWGRLNMDEFAMGSSNENSAFGPCSNPWNLDYIPGGSSGGCAAAVAAGQTVLALGSDTGGSVRQPAGLTGIVGLKPTYGLVSRYGLAAFASSFDQIGPLGRTVRDIAMLLQTIAGHDPQDSTSCRNPIPDYSQAFQSQDRRYVLGVPKEYFQEGLDSEVEKAVCAAIDFYQKRGYKIQEVSLPNMELALPVYYTLAPAEASSNLARYDGIRYTRRSQNARDAIDIFSTTRGEFIGAEVKRRILLGTYVLSSGHYDAYYLKAQKVRRMIYNEFMRVFDEVDVLITPTTPTIPFKKGERCSDPLAMYLADLYTVSVNLAGLPAISIPCGFSVSKLPIGLQLIGKPYREEDLFALAHTFEIDHDFANLHPQL